MVTRNWRAQQDLNSHRARLEGEGFIQLSYARELVTPVRIELTACRLGGDCSFRLSYDVKV